MFVLNQEKNKIDEIKSSSFTDLGFREREHLQEWIESNSVVFGEELLIIQKEFDGFGDTKERLDLLAMDKQGNLVVIENKLDDSGRDVTWQVLKYASYCSSLTKPQIKEIYQSYLNKKGVNEISEASISDFLGVEDLSVVNINKNQRIVLVANSFRKEVTSTVIWLLARSNLKIQCFKATPYLFNNKILLDIEQIIPVQDAIEYTIRMAEKEQEEQNTQDQIKERFLLRLDFWKLLLLDYRKKSNLFDNINPTKDSWISGSSGIGGVGFNFVVSKKYARAEVYISGSNTEKNKFIYGKLVEKKDEIDSVIPFIEWEPLENKKACRIKVENKNLSLYERNDWEEMIMFMTDSMLKIEQVFRPLIKKLKNDKELQKLLKKDNAG